MIFNVTNGNDAGVGSLRQAILEANSTGGPDQISVADGVAVTPLTPLPILTEWIEFASDLAIDGDLSMDAGVTVSFFGATTLERLTGAGDVTLADAASLHFQNPGSFTLRADLTGRGDLDFQGAGPVTLFGMNNAFAGLMKVSAGATVEATSGGALSDEARVDVWGVLRIVQSETVGGLSGQGSVEIASGQTLTIDQGDPSVFFGSISGDGGLLIKAGAQQLTLAGTNTYAGGTTLVGGTLVVHSSASLGTGALTIAGARLMVTSAGPTTIDTAIVLDGAAGYFSTNDQTLSGAITGLGSLNKTGVGTLTLTGLKAYTGGTTVTGGTLLVSGEIVSAALVQSGATLGGSGTVYDVTVAAGGTLAPGEGVGALQTGDLTFSASSIFAVELAGASLGQFDQAIVSGTVALNGATLNLGVIGGFSPAAGDTIVIIGNDGTDAVGGAFAGLAEGATVSAGGASFKISYVGGDGNDVTLTYSAPPSTGGGSGEPSNQPTNGDDVITLPPGGGQVAARAGDDKVTGGPGDDYIHGNQGADTLLGGGGADTILGGQGSDFVHGNQGDDVLYGDLGDDSVQGGQGQDFIHGNQGGDVLMGDLGDDTILGGQGDDVLQGGDGADYLSGDHGNDVLTGGAGADVFNFREGEGRDIITDFGAGDRIWLSLGDAADFEALASKITMAGEDAVISLAGQTIVLLGVSSTALTAQDFLFA